nr:hypothetical protein [Tanacetum cinerariifolium]
MATTDKESSVANTDNRPPMLVESDYESWKIRIERYIRVQVTRDKTDEEFTEIENNKELADIQATSILSQGLPRHVFNILNQMPAQSSNDAMLETMNQIMNLLSGFQKQFPPTNNHLRTSSSSRSHATVHDRHIVTETIQRKSPGNVGNTGTRGTQSYGQVTDNKGNTSKTRCDVECTAAYDQPLAITTTNIFEVSHEDAYDSDVDEGPHAAAAFMANFSSTNGATTSHVNEEEHLDSDVESDIDDNTIPYH